MQPKTFEDISTAAVHTRGGGRQAPELVPALTIISHPVTQRVGERLLLEPLAVGRPVELSRNAPDFIRPGGALGQPLGDPFISRKPLVLEPGPAGVVRLRVEEGGTAVAVAGEPVRGGWELSPQALAAGVPLELAGRVVVLLHLASTAPERATDTLGMVGQSVGLRRVREDISRVADLSVPVLVRGETGTGKELVARALHQRSPRRQGRFVSVNLGAIPKELATAELFGAQRGAYTGATREREGLFRTAHGGTLFLDEVGEAPPEVQVMLLRVLETGEMYPVGGDTPVAVDVRLVAATDANLEERINSGLFKAPLLHRLAGYEVRVPPLRERREDIGLLFNHFALQELEAIGEAGRMASTDPRAEPWLPAPLASRLVRYAWPGNIRQLHNVVRQLVIGSRGLPTLRADPRLEQELEAAATSPRGQSVEATPTPPPRPPRRKPSEVPEPELLEALRASQWDLKAAADRLGIPRTSIYELIDKSASVRTAGDLSPEEITRCFQDCQGDLEAMVRQLQVSRRALQRRLRELGLGSRSG